MFGVSLQAARVFVCLAYRVVGFTCLCEPGFIVNRDTGECTTQLCSDDEDTFCMNQGECQQPGACDCHREWIDHNCETCESATSRLLLNCIFVFKRVHAILTFPRLRLAEDSVFTGENLLKHPNHTDSLARAYTLNMENMEQPFVQ